jgi:hypothetical protein
MMNRGRQRNAKPSAESIDRRGHGAIDLGIALSVYGKDDDGRFVEIGTGDAQEPCWYGFSLSESSSTEH